MSLAERRVEYSREPIAARVPPRGVSTRPAAADPAIAGQTGQATAASAGACWAYHRLDAALLYAGVVSLLLLMAVMLYVADPLVHHDIDLFWHAVALRWAAKD